MGFIKDILGNRTFWLGIQVAANGVWWSFSWNLGEHNTCILTLHFQIHHVKLGHVELFNIQVEFSADRALRSMSAPDWCISLWSYCQLHHMCEFVSDYSTTEFFARQHIRWVLVDKPWDPGQFTHCHLSRHELTTTFAAMDYHVTIVRVLTLQGHNSSSPICNALSHSHGSEYVQWEIAWPQQLSLNSGASTCSGHCHGELQFTTPSRAGLLSWCKYFCGQFRCMCKALSGSYSEQLQQQQSSTA